MKEVPALKKFDASKKLASAEFVQQAQGSMVKYVGVNASRTLTADDMGAALYFTAPGLTLTIPRPDSLGIPANSGKYFKLFGLNQSTGTIASGAGVVIGYDVDDVKKIVVKQGQFITLMATAGQVWQVIDSTTELWRNADFTPHLASTGSQPLPGGFILQWIAAANAGGSGTAADTPYDMAFPNAVVAVSAIHIGSDTSVNITVDGSAPNKLAGVRLRSNYTNGASVMAYVLAIGY